MIFVKSSAKQRCFFFFMKRAAILRLIVCCDAPFNILKTIEPISEYLIKLKL